MPRRFAVCIVCIALLMQSLSSIPVSAQSSNSGEVNIELVVDSSGSMAGVTDTGAVRMDAAKQVLRQVVEAIPTDADINVGMRVYGHKGNNQESGRAESCASSELVVPVNGVATDTLLQQVDALTPVGWTPLGASLAAAGEDFGGASADAKNVVILLTDGIETCDGDPAGEAETLAASDAAIVTNVIGFATLPEDQASLQAIADAGNGELYSAANTAQLMEALFIVLEELEVVEEGGDGSSRYAPIGRGRLGTVGDFEVSVVDYIPDATDIVLGENPYNESPVEGHQFAMATLSVTYTGDASGNPGFDLSYNSVGESAVGYTTYDPGCGVYPDDHYSAGELFTGGTVEFNVCWSIDSDDESSLVMYIENFADFGSDPVWFSLGNPAPKSPDSSNDPNDDTESDSTPVDSESTEEDASSNTGTDLVTESSRTDPVPFGSTAKVGDFEVTVIDVTTNATDLVLEENPYNDPPESGYQFYIATLRVTSVANDAVNPGSDLSYAAVGESAVGYSTFDPGCGVYPNDMYSAGELFPGGTVEFNVCWSIDSGDEESLVMYIENYLDFNADPVWFALSD
jgi:hypothetical protein